MKTVIQILTISSIGFVVCIIAASTYGAFYISFVPTPVYEGSVHFTFEPCIREKGKCGFLNGSVTISDNSQPPILLNDQDYALWIELEMPESRINRDLGMFLTCAQIIGKDKTTQLRKVCKSTIMKYKSDWVRSLELLFKWPAILADYSGEKQFVHVQLIDDYRDDPMSPAVTIDFQVKSRFAEIYAARYQVRAKFTGLRYILHWFPMTSAMLGITFNIMWLMIILFLTFGFLAKSSTEEVSQLGNADDSGLHSGETVINANSASLLTSQQQCESDLMNYD